VYVNEGSDNVPDFKPEKMQQPSNTIDI